MGKLKQQGMKVLSYVQRPMCSSWAYYHRVCLLLWIQECAKRVETYRCLCMRLLKARGMRSRVLENEEESIEPSLHTFATS